MKLKRIVTVLTAVVAVGSAFAGNVDAKALMVQAGWYFVNPPPGQTAGPHDIGTVLAECPGGSDIICAFLLDGGNNEIDWLHYQ